MQRFVSIIHAKMLVRIVRSVILTFRLKMIKNKILNIVEPVSTACYIVVIKRG